MTNSTKTKTRGREIQAKLDYGTVPTLSPTQTYNPIIKNIHSLMCCSHRLILLLGKYTDILILVCT